MPILIAFPVMNNHKVWEKYSWHQIAKFTKLSLSYDIENKYQLVKQSNYIHRQPSIKKRIAESLANSQKGNKYNEAFSLVNVNYV